MTDQRNFRIEIPNIIDDLGLDPHERALYVHYKRTCGGSENCEWTESVRVTAKKTKMSHTRVSQARASLVGRGLIEIDSRGNDGTAVKVVNVWDLNSTYYAYKNGRPDIDGWTVGQLRDWCEGVNNIDTSKEKEPEESPGVNNIDSGVNNAYTGVNNIYNKKEPTKNQPEEFKREAQPVKKPKPKNKDSPPPAILVYRSKANLFPKKNLWPMIAEAVGESQAALDRWGQVVINYIACGWNPRNIKLMLEYFERGEVPGEISKTTRNGEGSGHNQPKSKRTAKTGSGKPGVISQAQGKRSVSNQAADSSGRSRDNPK